MGQVAHDVKDAADEFAADPELVALMRALRYADGFSLLIVIADHVSHVDRVLNGKAGTAMQSFKATLSDADLAAIITFERNSFGNKKGDMLQPAQIKALR